MDLYILGDERADGILGRAQYSPDLLDPSTITHLVEQYVTLLEVLVASPDMRIDQLAHRRLSYLQVSN